MFATVARCFLAAGAALALSTPAVAQEPVGAVSALDGPLTVHRRFAPEPGRVGAVLVTGDQLQTGDSRAEVAFLDGTILHLDTFTRVGLPERGRFQLLDGRIFIRTSSISASGYLAETSAARVWLRPRGIYGLMTSGRQHDALLRVVIGDARLETRWISELVTAHQTAFLSGPTGRPFVSVYVPPFADMFENWSATRTMMATLGPGSPARTVEDLEQHGPVIDEYREPQGSEFVNGYYYPAGSYTRGHRRDRPEHARKGSREEEPPPPIPVPNATGSRPLAPATAAAPPGALKGATVPRR